MAVVVVEVMSGEAIGTPKHSITLFKNVALLASPVAHKSESADPHTNW
jgi:hypothetical protein